MKKMLFLLLFISCNASAANWITSFEAAQKLAIGSNRLILVDFWATWCAPCRAMDQESWSDPEVEKLLGEFIPLRVDIDRNKSFANKYDVKAIPYVYIMDAHGEVLYKSRGYMNKEEVMEALKKYALNTEFLQRETLNYYKHENYVSSIRMAQKYMDYSLFLEGGVQNSFLEVAGNYLKNAKRSLDKKQSNYRFMLEKIDLIDLTIDLYSGNYNKVARQMEKIDSEALDAKNKVQYSFLKYCLAKVEKDEPAQEKWKEVLLAEDSDIYLKKSEMFTGK